jgi:uncharacterized protein DUF5937
MPPERVAQEVERSLTQRSGEPAPEAAWRLLDDRLEARATLADLLEQCWRLLIAPHGARLRDLLQADMLHRTQMQGDYGLERVLSELHPQARWTGHSLIIDAATAEQHELQGAGLLLMPSVFALARAGNRHRSASPANAHLSRRGYRRAVAARLHRPFSSAQPPTRPDPGGSAGITRRSSLHPHPGPAARACPSTVSEHLAILHHARLITLKRHRHTVLYEQTPLGTELAHGGQQPVEDSLPATPTSRAGPFLEQRRTTRPARAKS